MRFPSPAPQAGVTAISPRSHRSRHGDLNSALLLTEQACRLLHIDGIVTSAGLEPASTRLGDVSQIHSGRGHSLSWQRDLNSQPFAYNATALIIELCQENAVPTGIEPVFPP